MPLEILPAPMLSRTRPRSSCCRTVGIMRQVSAQQQRGVLDGGSTGCRQRLELQADCFAGVGPPCRRRSCTGLIRPMSMPPERRISGGGRHAAETGARGMCAVPPLIYPRLGGSASALVQHLVWGQATSRAVTRSAHRRDSPREGNSFSCACLVLNRARSQQFPMSSHRRAQEG